ncbi:MULTISPECIES: DUF6008 family protein [unclassified Streptomyces]|uniref:DUF6008 family protein n=1 Tax=unclassified Streptomyces TaxID=2593676 RepID=UPI001C61486E|nr:MULTISPECIES: DUF6008 family protein [unclassified Streptomyces]
MEHHPGTHEMGSTVSTLDTVGAVFFVLWTVAMWAAVFVIAYSNRRPARPWAYRTAVGVIGIGVVGQIGHFQEHVAQAGYWVLNPMEPAWMTPWGDSLARGLGQIDPSKPSLGMELLHLKGNLVFLAGLVGIALVTRRLTRDLRTRRWAKMGVWMQGVHGVEHLVLTLSVVLGASTAIGLSTWFGTIEAGPALTTYRVWWHFVANLVGTFILAMAVYHMWRERRVIEASYGIPPAGRGGDLDGAAARALPVERQPQPARRRD